MQLSKRSVAGHRTIRPKVSFSDDEDAITPCSSPPPEPQDLEVSSPAAPPAAEQQQQQQAPALMGCSSYSPKPSTTQAWWHLDPTHGQAMSDAQLWRRMLEIQRAFHCYNSARMSAALLELEMGGDAGHLAPSRSCLDLMNESVSDLPAEEKRRLADWLHENSHKKRRSGIWRRGLNI